ncbi:SMI1/KNR4 family protein [Sphingomonas psychrotolerans]|uniref:SMI1/KNR4 family protein n=1 Tax=Sphingomonas psychrotolerans TaxID=1327635 RepID=A0ABU3N6J5_9SPHN|nr:YrhA family protein [Sphingomonas psychrotolerans]MDT8759076.1 SMI1/KNR4 family protein [Sphingomonas psychrotolerans]
MDAVIVAARDAQVAVGETVQARADESRIAALRAALQREFGATLPDDYAALLRRSDGVDFDGLVLYGSWQSEAAPGPAGFWQGLVAANRLWREGPGHDGYLVLGETDIDLFTVDLDGTNPVLRDKVSGDLNETFPSVTAAIRRLLATRG